MMSLWDALRMNMMISYQELVRTFPNRRHQHDYYFNFFNNNGDIFVTVEIKGENPLKFTRSLNDMRQQFSPVRKGSPSHFCKVISSDPS